MPAARNRATGGSRPERSRVVRGQTTTPSRSRWRARRSRAEASGGSPRNVPWTTLPRRTRASLLIQSEGGSTGGGRLAGQAPRVANSSRNGPPPPVTYASSARLSARCIVTGRSRLAASRRSAPPRAVETVIGAWGEIPAEPLSRSRSRAMPPGRLPPRNDSPSASR